MVRKYNRKTLKTDSAAIVNGIRAIEIGMSIRAAARSFNVSERALRRHLNTNRSNTSMSVESMEVENVEVPVFSTSVASTSTEAVALTPTETVVSTSNTKLVIIPRGGQTVCIFFVISVVCS